MVWYGGGQVCIDRYPALFDIAIRRVATCKAWVAAGQGESGARKVKTAAEQVKTAAEIARTAGKAVTTAAKRVNTAAHPACGGAP